MRLPKFEYQIEKSLILNHKNEEIIIDFGIGECRIGSRPNRKSRGKYRKPEGNKGTAKISELPANESTSSIYNGANNKTGNFTGTRTVVSNNDGVLGYVDGLPLAASLGEKSKCVNGHFGRDHLLQELNTKSLIEIDDIRVRYNHPNAAAADGTYSHAQIQSTRTPYKVTFFIPGSFLTAARFDAVNNTNWTKIITVNYDAEGSVIGYIMLTDPQTERVIKVFRYSAFGWKDKSNSPSGFCHGIQKVDLPPIQNLSNFN